MMGGHFFGAAAEAMRRILVENARRKQSLKRAHSVEHAAVDGLAETAPPNTLDLLALDEALTEFERQWPEKSKLVELRYFVGLTVQESAKILGISVATAERHWTFARVWLYKQLKEIRSSEEL